MADVITSINPLTELEAVNEMLSSVGEAPLPADTDLSAATAQDILLALQILRKTTRDVQTEGWRFNSEKGVALEPVGLVAYGSTTLGVFKVPAGVLKWKQTACQENQTIDLVERPSKVYREADEPVMVLYDRLANRDGVAQAAVYLDLVWGFNFTQMPEIVRTYAAVRSARLFAEKAMGSSTLSSFTEAHEYAALRALKDDQGEVEQLNLFNHPESYDARGRRPRPDARPGYSVTPAATSSTDGFSDGGLY